MRRRTYIVLFVALFLTVRVSYAQIYTSDFNTNGNQTNSQQTFQSTAILNNGTYTIPFVATDLNNVGEATVPSYIATVGVTGPQKAPIIDSGDTPPELPNVNPNPVGDGTWLLLACATMLFALRAWRTLRMKKV